MRILIVDDSHESQAACAAKFKAIPPREQERLDLSVSLNNGQNISERLSACDVVVIGPGFREAALNVVKRVHSAAPLIPILMLVCDRDYRENFFQSAYSAGARRVLHEDVKELDLIQELASIHNGFMREGKARLGRLVLVNSIKGGSGATTLTAALGEACNDFGMRTLLVDLDYETRDLSRALGAFGIEGHLVGDWISGKTPLNRDNFASALVQVGREARLLMPPKKMAEAFDMMCHPEGIEVVRRMLELARASHDVVIVDGGGVSGPTKAFLMREADAVLVLLGDSPLGLSGLETYLEFCAELMGGSTDNLSLMWRGSDLSAREMRKLLDPQGNLPERAWNIPVLPEDPKAVEWAGTNNTLYSLGNRTTRAAIEAAARALGMVDRDKGETGGFRALAGKILRRGGAIANGPARA